MTKRKLGVLESISDCDVSPPPVVYVQNFVDNPDAVLDVLSSDLEWERRGDVPRSEYYCNDTAKPYEYGVGRGRRLYMPRQWHPAVLEIRTRLEDRLGAVLDVCFMNRYADQTDHLGWHSDDSPEMDDARPICTVSLGVEREIWFRPKPEVLNVTGDTRANVDRRWTTRGSVERRQGNIPTHRITLENGSVCVMNPGMQDTWQHRIPKASFKCGTRISLTFRGYVV